MTTPELIAYIKNAMAKGQTKDAIKAPLLSAGWNEADVMEAFNVVNPPVTPSMPKSSMLSSSAIASMPMTSANPAPATSSMASSVSPQTMASKVAAPMASAVSSAPISQPIQPAAQPIQPLSRPATYPTPTASQASVSAQPVSSQAQAPVSRQYFTGMPAQTRPTQSMPVTMPSGLGGVQQPKNMGPLPSQAPTINPNMSTMSAQPMVDQKPKTNFFRVFINFFLIGAFLFSVWYFYGAQIGSFLGLTKTPTPSIAETPVNTIPPAAVIPPVETTPAPPPVETPTPSSLYSTTGSATAADLINISISPNDTVTGKMTITGAVPIDYFFNGKIGVNVLDANKAVLKYGAGSAMVDSTISGATSFTATVDFTPLAKGAAYLEIHNNNSSHLPANDKSVLVPIIIQ